MTEQQIKHMVNRFLGWKLPAAFNPDAGISFKAAFNEHTAYPMRHEPVGTNLFDADQADAMVRYMLEGMPAADTLAVSPSTSLRLLTDALQERYREQRGDLRAWSGSIASEPNNRVTPKVRQLAAALAAAYRSLDAGA